jgi:hypothetical protein
MLKNWWYPHTFLKQIYNTNDDDELDEMNDILDGSDNNTLFEGKSDFLYHTRFIWDWTRDENGYRGKTKLFSQLNGEDVDRGIVFDAFISSVDVPEDLQMVFNCCPKCGSKPSIFRIRRDSGFGSAHIRVCTHCSDLKWEDGHHGEIIDNTNTEGICQPDKFTFNLQSQRIVITHPDSMKKCAVYVHSNRPMFNKKDVGKKYTFKGILRTPDEFTSISQTIGYPEELVELIRRHQKQDKKMSYLMIAPHIEAVPIDDSMTESAIVKCTREDVSPEWRKEVLARDKHCVICGGEKHLEAHHIFGYNGYPQLRDNVDNGITLCQFCHGNYHSQYGVKNPNPVSFVQFIRKFR